MDGLPPEVTDLLKSMVNNHPYIAIGVIAVFGAASLIRALSALLTEVKNFILAMRAKNNDGK